jgi:type I restriction enzyme, S subunit
MPVGWSTVRLADIARIQGGGTPNRAEPGYFGGNVPWVTPTDLPAIGKIGVLGEVAEALTQAGLENSSARLIAPGSVLFSSRATIGKIAVTDRLCATNQGFINLTPVTEVVNPWFLANLLGRYTEELKALAGKTTFLEIPRGRFKDFEVQIPPLAEQDRILARIEECIERVEEIETLRFEAIREAQAVLASVLNEVFTAQAGACRLQTIGDVAVETRYGTSQKCHPEPAGMPILRIPNVADGAVNLANLKYCRLERADAARVQLQDGDLLFVRTNGSRDLVGRCAVFRSPQDGVPFGFASYLIRVRVNKNQVLPRYLSYFLNSTNGRAEIDSRRRTSAGQFNINSENLRSIAFPVPSIGIQERLLEQLKEREAQAKQLVREMSVVAEEGATIRKAIVRKAFAGEL